MPEAQKLEHLKKLAALMRYHILTMTTQAGSGHPTSSLSAVELMAGLMFGGSLRYDLDNPKHPNNDRLIFSKGHATPLFYTLWAMAGRLTAAELMTYRHFGSPLEGHPTMSFPYTEAATGSLGQGLAIGLGVALNAKYLDKLPYTTYVLLGDSEMAEGSQWETMQLAAHYKLDNLVGILDVNRLGQRGETMYGHDLLAYEERIGAFGWETILINDGHSFPEILAAFNQVMTVADKPVMIIAKTIKGKGLSFLENQNGWHGKTLSPAELERALPELGPVDHSVRGVVSPPEDLKPDPAAPQLRRGTRAPVRGARPPDHPRLQTGPLAPLGPVYQAGTLSGNPLAMCAGFAALSYIKEHPEIYVQLEKASMYLENGFKENLKAIGKNYSMNRIGSMMCMFFTEKPVNDFKSALTSNTELYGKYFHEMLNGGIYLAPAQFEALFVSTAHTKQDLDKTIAAHKEAFKAVI